MSNNPPMFVETQPASAVAFNYKPQKDIMTSLLLINITNKPVLFKLRTTAPTCYVVKPNFGMLLPSQIIDVGITMQASDFDPKVSAKNDRFQVNAILCPEGLDPNVLIANSVEFQNVWDSIGKSQKQAKNLSVEFILESGENVGAGAGSNGVPEIKVQRNTIRSGDQSSLSDDSSGLKNENSASFFSVNTSTLTSAQVLKDKAISEKKKEEENFYKQRIAFLQKNVDKLTAENQMLKMKNQDIIDKSSKQEKLMQELKDEKLAFTAELAHLKTTTFKKRNAKERIKDTFMSEFEFWHILSICIIGLILGRLIMSFIN